MRRHDGEYRTFLARAVPTRNEQGELVRWLGTATDIHEQKLAEEVVRRTEKLAATGRLAASMAHEINNPLESVTNSLYLALQDPGPRAAAGSACDDSDAAVSPAIQIAGERGHGSVDGVGRRAV
jgi:signal transduction histidine kinase